MKILRDDGQVYGSPELAAKALAHRPGSTFIYNGEDVTQHVQRVLNRLIKQEQTKQKRQDIGATGLYE